jgi:hypothetical protein
MLDYRIWQAVSIFVIVGGLFLLLQVVRNHASWLRNLGFVLLSAVSLIFALSAISHFGASRQSPYFVELGQFFPLPDKDNPDKKPDITVGDKDHDPDVRLDGFQGLITLSYERYQGQGEGQNQLKVTATDLKQPLSVYEAGGDNKTARQVIRAGGAGPVFIPVSTPALFRAVIETSPEGQAEGNTVTFEVQLKAENAMLSVYRPKPYRIIPLVGLPLQKNEKQELVPRVRISDDPDPASDAGQKGAFLPTVSVESGSRHGNVRTFLELPLNPSASDDADDFVINNGLTKFGYAFGTEVPVGSRRGALITVEAPTAPVSRWMVVIVLLWALTALFFLSSSFISRRNGLWVLLPLVQLLLAFRLVLSLRAYLFPPYNAEGVEGAILGELLIPLMIFSGLFSAVLRLLPDGVREGPALGRAGRLKKVWNFLNSFPPFYYWVSTLLMLPAVFYLLQTSTQRASYLFKSAAAFEWGDLRQPLLILLLAPPMFWLLSILADKWLRRAFKRSAGAEYKNYGGPADEPITYALENPASEYVPSYSSPAVFRRVPEWCWWAGLMLCGALAATLWLGPVRAALDANVRGVVLALAGAAAAVALWHLRGSTATRSRTLSVAFEGLLVVALVTGLLWLMQLLGLRSREVFLRWVPFRASAAMQLLGFALTMRLLAVFFHHDWRQLDDRLSGRRLWGFFAAFVAPLLYIFIPSLATGDLGATLVNWPPLLGMALAVTGSSVFMKGLHGLWRWASVGLSFVLLAFVLLVFTGTENVPGLSHRLVDEVLVKNMPKSTVTHRILLRGGQARAEGAALTGGGEELIGAMEQLWKMLHYAAHGGHRGYEEEGRPALVPIPEGKWDSRGNPKDQSARFALVSLSDAVFSTYVMGEHGLWGGACLLLLYFLLFVIICLKALKAFSESIMRIALLVGVALALTYPAIYVAAANVNGAIFTGQDMPLLGLRSYTDLLHSGLLLALLAAGLAAAGVARESAAARSVGQQIAKRNLIVLGLLVLLLTLWTFWCLLDVTVVNQAKYLEPFNLDYLNDKLQVLLRQESIKIKRGTTDKLDQDRWATRGVAGDLVPDLVDKYNARPDGQRGDDYDQTQWFQIDKARGLLTVNRTRYYQPSPFRVRQRWQGALTEGNKEAADALVGAGVSLRLYHAHTGEPVPDSADKHVEVNLSDGSASDTPRREFLVSDNGGPGGTKRSLFTIYTMNDAEGAVLDPGLEPDLVYLNGLPLYDRDKGKPLSVRLDYGDTVAVAAGEEKAGPAGGPARQPQYLFTYQREEVASFSYPAWFNGEQQRVYPQREAFPSVLLIAEAVEREAPPDAQDLPLTLNARLNSEVYKKLVGARVKGEEKRRMAVTLMNPDNGDLLVLASDNGKVYDPEDEGDAREVRKSPHLANVNFARHVIGSTVKPLTAAATLYSFPSLTKMTINDTRLPSGRNAVFGIPFGKDITTRKRSVVDFNQFLAVSDNLYEMSLGLMGLTVDDGKGSVQFGDDKEVPGPQVQVGDGQPSSKRPLFPEGLFGDDPGNLTYVDRLKLMDSPLARNYETLFDVRRDAQIGDYDTGLWENAKELKFLNKVEGNNNLFAVSPERTNLSLKQMSKTWELRSILLGGGVGGPTEYGSLGNEWCNVLQAQALARIITGKEVKARLVVNGQPQFKEWAQGGLPPEPWRLYLLRGLQGVATLPDGTAYGALHSFIDGLNKSVGGREQHVGDGGEGKYFTVFSKTGTLDADADPDTPPDSIFMFAAGIWDERTHRLEDPLVGVVYIERGGGGRAAYLAKNLLDTAERYYNWGCKLDPKKPCY